MNSAPFDLEPMTEITVMDEGCSASHAETNGDRCAASEAISIAFSLPREGEDVPVDKEIRFETVAEDEGAKHGAFDSATVEVHVSKTSSEGIIVDEAMVEIGGEPLQIDENSTVFTPPSKESMAQNNYIVFNSQQLKPRVMLPGLRKKWQEKLKSKGSIMCPVPSCRLKFFTLFSFERHYRWCTGEKGEGVERCLYCDGQFLSNDCGIVEHISQDHPEKLTEYKALKRAAARKNKKVQPVRKKKDVVVYMNNSGNVDKVVSTKGSTATVVSSIPVVAAPPASDGERSEEKPPSFSTRQFQIRKMSPTKDKKVKFKNKAQYFSGCKRAISKEGRMKRVQHLRSRKKLKLEEEALVPRLRKFPGTARITQLPEGMKVYSPKKKQLLGIVIENSRNWSAPRRTYSRNTLTSPEGGKEENWMFIASSMVEEAQNNYVPEPEIPVWPETPNPDATEDRFQLKCDQNANTTLTFVLAKDEEEESEEDDKRQEKEPEKTPVSPPPITYTYSRPLIAYTRPAQSLPRLHTAPPEHPLHTTDTSAEQSLHITPAEQSLHITPAEHLLHTEPSEHPLCSTPVEHPLHINPVEHPLHTTPAEHPPYAATSERPLQTTPESPVHTTSEHSSKTTTTEHPLQASAEHPLCATSEQPLNTTTTEQPPCATPAEHPLQTTHAEHPLHTTPAEHPLQTAPAERPLRATPAEHPLQTAPAEHPLKTTPTEHPLGLRLSHVTAPAVTEHPLHGLHTTPSVHPLRPIFNNSAPLVVEAVPQKETPAKGILVTNKNKDSSPKSNLREEIVMRKKGRVVFCIRNQRQFIKRAIAEAIMGGPVQEAVGGQSIPVGTDSTMPSAGQPEISDSVPINSVSADAVSANAAPENAASKQRPIKTYQRKSGSEKVLKDSAVDNQNAEQKQDKITKKSPTRHKKQLPTTSSGSVDSPTDSTTPVGAKNKNPKQGKKSPGRPKKQILTVPSTTPPNVEKPVNSSTDTSSTQDRNGKAATRDGNMPLTPSTDKETINVPKKRGRKRKLPEAVISAGSSDPNASQVVAVNGENQGQESPPTKKKRGRIRKITLGDDLTASDKNSTSNDDGKVAETQKTPVDGVQETSPKQRGRRSKTSLLELDKSLTTDTNKDGKNADNQEVINNSVQKSSEELAVPKNRGRKKTTPSLPESNISPAVDVSVSNEVGGKIEEGVPKTRSRKRQMPLPESSSLSTSNEENAETQKIPSENVLVEKGSDKMEEPVIPKKCGRKRKAALNDSSLSLPDEEKLLTADTPINATLNEVVENAEMQESPSDNNLTEQSSDKVNEMVIEKPTESFDKINEITVEKPTESSDKFSEITIENSTESYDMATENAIEKPTERSDKVNEIVVDKTAKTSDSVNEIAVEKPTDQESRTSRVEPASNSASNVPPEPEPITTEVVVSAEPVTPLTMENQNKDQELNKSEIVGSISTPSQPDDGISPMNSSPTVTETLVTGPQVQNKDVLNESITVAENQKQILDSVEQNDTQVASLNREGINEKDELRVTFLDKQSAHGSQKNKDNLSGNECVQLASPSNATDVLSNSDAPAVKAKEVCSKTVITMREEGGDEHTLPLKKRRVENLEEAAPVVASPPNKKRRGRPTKKEPVATPLTVNEEKISESNRPRRNRRRTFSMEEAFPKTARHSKHTSVRERTEETPVHEKASDGEIQEEADADVEVVAVKTRGRKKKKIIGSPKRENVCSACKRVFTNIAAIKSHIIHNHEGLAKINDDSPMTETEAGAALKKAFKIKSFLQCRNADCGRKLRSFLGYVIHSKNCGKEVELVSCEFCDSKLKASSYYTHKRKHLEKLQPKESVEADDSDSDKTKPPRQASVRAKTKMQEFIKRQEIGLTEADKDSEYELSGEEYESKEIRKDVVADRSKKPVSADRGKKPVAITDFSKRFVLMKLKAWEGNYDSPEHQRPITKEILKIWTQELEEKGTLTCGFEHCKMSFGDVEAMRNHWQCCGLKMWRCLICGYIGTANINSIWQHLKTVHPLEAPSELPKGDVSAYKQCIYALPNIGQETSFSVRNPLCFQPATKWTYDFYKKHYRSEVFPNWRPRQEHWKKLEEYKEFLPPFKESVKFRMKNDDKTWNRLKLFESSAQKCTTDQIIFNVGGPVWSSDWCPEPVTAKCRQYVVLDARLDPDKSNSMMQNKGERSLLQLWDLGLLDKKSVTIPPRLALAIAIDYSTVYEMKWCPSGCRDDPDSLAMEEGTLPRLGLLALACGDGFVRILSIPHPGDLTQPEEVLPMYSARPVVELLPPSSGSTCITTWHASCTTISWQRTDGHKMILSGYASGTVCRWDLSTESPLLVVSGGEQSPRRLRPSLVFRPHNSPVYSLVWCTVPGGRFMVTTGLDRTVKLWDLENLCTPVHAAKRGFYRALAWSCHWNGHFGALDDCYNLGHSLVLYKEAGYYGHVHKPLSSHNACTWALSISEWMNIEASTDAAGEVVMTVLCRLDRNLDLCKKFPQRRLPIYRIDIEPLEETADGQVATTSASSADEEIVRVEKDCERNDSAEREPSSREDRETNPIAEKVVRNGGVSESNAMEQEPSCSREKAASFKKATSKSLYRTYGDITQKFGLVFVDSQLASEKGLAESEHKRVMRSESMNSCPPSQYQIASVNTVAWSCNFRSRKWLFTAGQAGLGRISCVSALGAPTVPNTSR